MFTEIKPECRSFSSATSPSLAGMLSKKAWGGKTGLHLSKGLDEDLNSFRLFLVKCSLAWPLLQPMLEYLGVVQKWGMRQLPMGSTEEMISITFNIDPSSNYLQSRLLPSYSNHHPLQFTLLQLSLNLSPCLCP